MTKRQRVTAALKGDQVDRAPVSAWMHFPLRDRTAEGQVEAFRQFQEKYDWDFMKLMFRSTFLLEDWGCRYEEYQRPLGYWLLNRLAVNSVGDWKKLRVLDVHDGVLGEMLRVVRGIKTAVADRDDLFKLATVFVPIMVAKQISGDRVFQDLRDHPKDVHYGLEIIAETLKDFAGACIESGCDGIFYATQCATTDFMSVKEYREFGRPYDLAVLNGFQDRSQFTMLHICGANIMFDEFADYPVHAYNWDDRTTAPSLSEARKKTDRCLIGGINRMGVLRTGSPGEVTAEANASIASAGKRKLILAPGCGVPMDVPENNLKALRSVVEP